MRLSQGSGMASNVFILGTVAATHSRQVTGCTLLSDKPALRNLYARGKRNIVRQKYY